MTCLPVAIFGLVAGARYANHLRIRMERPAA